jgi:hypothetical protein
MSDITATSHVEAESAAGAEPELPLPQAPQPADRATARTVGGPSWSDQGQEEAVGDEAAPDARFRTAAFLAAAFAGAAIGAGIGRDAGGRIVGALVGLLVGYGIGYGVLWLNGQIGGPPRGPPLRMLASYGRRGLGALRRGIPIILLLAAFAAVGVAISVFTDPRTRNTVAPSARQASAPFLRPNALPTVADRAPVADEAKSKAQAAEHEAEATAKFRAGIAATLAAGMHPDRVARDLDLFPAARFVVPAPSRQRPSDPEPGPPRIVVLFGLLDPAADGASPCTLACYFDVDAYARKTVGGQSGKVADSSLELIGYEFGLGTFSQVGLTLRSPTWADPFDSTGATLFAP